MVVFIHGVFPSIASFIGNVYMDAPPSVGICTSHVVHPARDVLAVHGVFPRIASLVGCTTGDVYVGVPPSVSICTLHTRHMSCIQQKMHYNGRNHHHTCNHHHTLDI
ncbi:hypothetical protein OROMI_029556 [Orobanche minor]